MEDMVIPRPFITDEISSAILPLFSFHTERNFSDENEDAKFSYEIFFRIIEAERSNSDSAIF